MSLIAKAELLVLIARPIGWRYRKGVEELAWSAGLDHMGRIATGEVLDRPLWECPHRHRGERSAQRCARKTLRIFKRAVRA